MVERSLLSRIGNNARPHAHFQSDLTLLPTAIHAVVRTRAGRQDPACHTLLSSQIMCEANGLSARGLHQPRTRYAVPAAERQYNGAG